MPGRKRKDLRRSKKLNDQDSRPNSSHASGQSTPDPRSSSQPNVDQPALDPRPSVEPTPDLRRILAPYPGGQRAPASSQPIDSHFGDQPALDPRPSDEPTPDLRRIIAPYPGGQRVPVPGSSGQRTVVPRSSISVSRSSDQPSINPPLGLQSASALPSRHEPTPSLRRTTARYRGGQRTLVPSSSDQPAPVPRPSYQPTPGVRSSGQNTPNLRPVTDPHRSVQGTAVPRSSAESTPAPRSSTPVLSSSGSRTFNPYFGVQATPDPRTSGQPTPNQQRTADPYPGGQRVLESNSSGHPINNGIYTITNVHHDRFVYLEDPNDNTPLMGHYNPEKRSARWYIKSWGNEQYTIENVDHNRYANCGPLAALKAFVEGHSRDQLWRIQERPTGEYTIATTDTRNLWMLPYDEPDTPVWLSDRQADPRCWWTFETAAPVNENFATLPIEPKLPLVPPGGQSIPEGANLGFLSVITQAIDLLKPLGAVCEALRVVLQRAESIGHVNEDQNSLIKRLKFHLATIENDIAKLGEDQNIDKIIPTLNRDVRESLETYARELKEIYKLLSDNQTESSFHVRKVTSFGDKKGIIGDKTIKINETFQTYTAALHQLAANKVAQMQQQLAQFRQEPQQGVHTAAEKARPNRPNAYGIQHRECLQGTREKTIAAIRGWAGEANTEKWIFFFLDVAGSGKSTVAKHMAEKWEREGRLLARFFFSRDTTETMSTNVFCSTVAGAFAALDPTYKEHMDKFMKLPNVELLSFEKRFEGLVVGPLRATGRHAILIIDALDECDAEQRDQLLQTLRDKHSSMPLLRILATGRPERDIKCWAEEKFSFGYANFVRLEESEKDVELYIKHALQNVPDVQDRLYPVIRRAEGLFIWARIACDLLLDSDDIDSLLEELGKEVHLDYLYKVALEQSMPKEGPSRRAMVLVLQLILAAKEPLSIVELEMLSPKRGVVEKVVTRLSSVLLYQGREDPIRLLHATFREFLTTRSKADIFFIQPEIGHHMLASGCLTSISYLSKQDDSILRKLDEISQRKGISFEQDIY